MKKIVYIVLLVLPTLFVHAQQESVFTFSNYHMNVINPAYVGVDNETTLTASVRKQWAGVQFAPETQAVSFGTTLGRNLGFGVSIMNDVTFVEKQTFVGLDFSYKLSFDRDSNLYFGLKAGGSTYSVNTAGLETYNVISDPNLASISSFNPNIGIGLLYKMDNFYVSFSIPRLLNTTVLKTDDVKAFPLSDTPHYYLGSGHNFDLSGTIKLKPSVLLRYVKGAPFSYELNTMFDYNNLFELGVLYRNKDTYAAKSIIKISERFQLGFAYEIASRQLAAAGNTNEFFMNFKF